MKEVWKPIKGFEEKYEVSNLGRVRSIPRITKFMHRGILKTKKFNNYYILKPYKLEYYVVCLWKNNTNDVRVIHRMVGEAFIPNPNNYPQINHKDLNKFNNVVSNLEWCTGSQNAKHASDRGKWNPIFIKGALLHKVGTDNFSAKLDEEKVKEIRKIYMEGGFSTRTLANLYRVNQSTISRVINQKAWSHVK